MRLASYMQLLCVDTISRKFKPLLMFLMCGPFLWNSAHVVATDFREYPLVGFITTESEVEGHRNNSHQPT